MSFGAACVGSARGSAACRTAAGLWRGKRKLQIARRAHRPGDEGECYQEPDPTGPGVPKSTRPGCLLSSLPRRLKRRRVVIVKLGCIRGRRGESDTTQTQTQGCWGPLVMSISNLVDGERHFEQR